MRLLEKSKDQNHDDYDGKIQLPNSELKAQSNSFRNNGLKDASLIFTTSSMNVEIASCSTYEIWVYHLWRMLKDNLPFRASLASQRQD